MERIYIVERKVAIVTGPTRGIGLGLFRRLAAEKTIVAGVYNHDEVSAESFRREVEKLGVDFLLEKMDVREFNKIPDFVGAVRERFGRVDYLVNNVGTDVAGTIFNVTRQEWQTSQDILLNAPFHFMKAVLPHMRERKYGRIVNLGASSTDYTTGAPGVGPFGIHKAALSILTKTLAMEEIQNGITVNMVAPGSTSGAGVLPEEERIPLSMIPLGRRVSVEEVVEAIRYFLSDQAAAVTGQFLGINGGMST
jgi:NAD(P)-dependent dehydrogenase (short-subunit alcohol dehydrogenase family)